MLGLFTFLFLNKILKCCLEFVKISLERGEGGGLRYVIRKVSRGDCFQWVTIMLGVSSR